MNGTAISRPATEWKNLVFTLEAQESRLFAPLVSMLLIPVLYLWWKGRQMVRE